MKHPPIYDQLESHLINTEVFDEVRPLLNENKKLRTTLRQFIDAFDAGAIQLSSADVQIDDEQPHPWHEEWLSYARSVLSPETA